MVKYGNTLESSRKDGRLANTDNIYDKRTGEMQEAINLKIANVSTADEEDLTKTIDEEGRSVTKFADRSYSPSTFSGKGYKILRKNIQKISLAVVNISVNTPPSSDGYVSFIINGIETHVDLVTSTDNTTALVAEKIAAKLAETMTEYEVSQSDASVTLTRKFGGTVLSASSFSANSTGASCEISNSTKSERRNLLTSTMLDESDTIYEIRYDFNLNGATINIPSGCVLKFDGGILRNGNVNFNNTQIIGNFFSHIGGDLEYNVHFKNDKSEICVDDFGADPNGIKLSTEAINKAILYCSYNKITRPIQFYGTYLIDDAIMLESNIILQGNDSTIFWDKLKWTMVFGTEPFKDGGYKNITIKGFHVDCDSPWTYIYEDGKDKSWPRGVFAFSNVDGLIIEDCRRTYPGSIQPAWICGCSNVVFRNCKFERTLTAEQFSGESNGIWIYSTGKVCKNILIEDCYIKGYRDECIGIINTIGVNKDWSYSDVYGNISDITIRNNTLIGGSYAITIGNSSTSNGYVGNVLVIGNVIKNSTIIVRRSAQDNYTIANNSFLFDINPATEIELVLVEHNENSKLNLVRISNNNMYGETNTVRFLQIGKCKRLEIVSNTFAPRYNPESGIILRGIIPLGVLIKDNVVSGNTVLVFINSIVNTNIEILNNTFKGWCGFQLNDNGNPYILKIFNNCFNNEIIMNTIGNGHPSDDSIFQGNLINGCTSNSFLNSIFSIKNIGFNCLRYKDGGSRFIFGNIPTILYEGWCQSVANNTNTKGIILGSSSNTPMIISNSKVKTLRGIVIPSDALAENKVNIIGELSNAPTEYLTEENKGYLFYDTKYNCTIEWDGKKWISVGNKTGTTEDRPVFDTTAASVYKGLQYYDTTLNKPIWWNGSKWVDVNGTDM